VFPLAVDQDGNGGTVMLPGIKQAGSTETRPASSFEKVHVLQNKNKRAAIRPARAAMRIRFVSPSGVFADFCG